MVTAVQVVLQAGDIALLGKPVSSPEAWDRHGQSPTEFVQR
jgi:hypothetical protein